MTTPNDKKRPLNDDEPSPSLWEQWTPSFFRSSKKRPKVEPSHVGVGTNSTPHHRRRLQLDLPSQQHPSHDAVDNDVAMSSSSTHASSTVEGDVTPAVAVDTTNAGTARTETASVAPPTPAAPTASNNNSAHRSPWKSYNANASFSIGTTSSNPRDIVPYRSPNLLGRRRPYRPRSSLLVPSRKTRTSQWNAQVAERILQQNQSLFIAPTEKDDSRSFARYTAVRGKRRAGINQTGSRLPTVAIELETTTNQAQPEEASTTVAKRVSFAPQEATTPRNPDESIQNRVGTPMVPKSQRYSEQDSVSSSTPSVAGSPAVASPAPPRTDFDITKSLVLREPATPAPIVGGQFVASGYPANALQAFQFQSASSPYQPPRQDATFVVNPDDYAMVQQQEASQKQQEDASIYDLPSTEPDTKKQRIGWAGTNLAGYMATNEWNCSACDCRNPDTVTACLSCTTPRPGVTATEETGNAPAAPASKFTFNASAAAPKDGGFTFGVTPGKETTATASTSGFTFGATTTETSAAASRGGITFGATADTTTKAPAASTGGFTFEAKADSTKQVPPAAATGGFSFGTKADSTKQVPPAATTGGFSFGAKTDSTKQVPAARATGGFSFGAKADSTAEDKQVPAAATGGFSLGAKVDATKEVPPQDTGGLLGGQKDDKPKPSFPFGAIPATESAPKNGAKEDTTKAAAATTETSAASAFSLGDKPRTEPKPFDFGTTAAATTTSGFDLQFAKPEEKKNDDDGTPQDVLPKPSFGAPTASSGFLSFPPASSEADGGRKKKRRAEAPTNGGSTSVPSFNYLGAAAKNTAPPAAASTAAFSFLQGNEKTPTDAATAAQPNPFGSAKQETPGTNGTAAPSLEAATTTAATTNGAAPPAGPTFGTTPTTGLAPPVAPLFGSKPSNGGAPPGGAPSLATGASTDQSSSKPAFPLVSGTTSSEAPDNKLSSTQLLFGNSTTASTTTEATQEVKPTFNFGSAGNAPSTTGAAPDSSSKLTFDFGASTASTTTAAPPFGGAPSAAAPSAPFASTPAPAAPGFGGSTTSSQPAPGFAEPTPQPFGGPPTTPAAPTSSFGAPASTAPQPPNFGGAASTAPGFGGPQAASAPNFGAPGGTPNFGAPPSTTTPSFGAPPAPGFGGPAPAPAAPGFGGPGFGSTSAPTSTTSSFGAPNFGGGGTPNTMTPQQQQPGGLGAGMGGAMAAGANVPTFSIGSSGPRRRRIVRAKRPPRGR